LRDAEDREMLTQGTAAIPDLETLTGSPRSVTPPVVAVVQPVSEAALTGALDAADRRLVRPLLVGETPRIRAVLQRLGKNPEAFEIEAAQSDGDAAAKGVALVRAGRAQVLMKGHLHTDEFLRPVVDKRKGLRTSRRMSHAFICFFRNGAYHKPLVITDAAMNIAPDFVAKVDVLRNAIDLLHGFGVPEPKIAILAASELPHPEMPATRDATRLAESAERGDFGEAVVEGPLGFDNAISAEAASAKGIRSRVAGDPDVLLVPDIQAGNILYKSMVYFCGVIAAGVVLGAQVPLLLTSRTEPIFARTASCAIAAHLVQGTNARGA
jgi:phosphate acetyltransferase